MQLDTASDKFTVSGRSVKEQSMTVKNTSKLFSLMIDGLYQDKYGSVVRELSANAIDAHKSAGCSERPFEITIPNGVVNTFIIRDYGNGVSKDDIIKYFGTLLESSKDQENESIGAFGLGCKSPFSIVNEFSVTSIKNGQKTTVLFIREQLDTPRFFVIYEGKTDEESGTTVFFEDKSEKAYTKWVDAVQRQLCALTVKPIIHNYDEIKYPEIKQFGNIGFVEKGLPRDTYINMGQILYPINKSDFADENVKFINSPHTLIYQCEIGEITVLPNRENIELKTKTIDTIRRVAEVSYEQVSKNIGERFSKEFTGKYDELIKYTFESKFSGVDINETLSPHIDINKLIGKHNVAFLKENAVFPYKGKNDPSPYNILVNNVSFHDKVIKPTMVSLYNRSGSYVSISKNVLISFNNIFSGDKVVVTNNGRVIDLGDKMRNEKFSSATLLRVKSKYVEDIVELLKTLAPIYGKTADDVLILEKNNAITYSFNTGKGTSVKRRIKTQGLFQWNGRYDYGALDEDHIDALLSEEDIILLKKSTWSSRARRNSEDVDEWMLSQVDCKIIFASHDQYMLYKDKKGAHTFANYVKKFMLNDIQSIEDALYSENELGNMFKNSRFTDEISSIDKEHNLKEKLVQRKLNDIMGDLKEISIKDISEKVTILNQQYLSILEDIIIPRSKVYLIASQYVSRRMI